MKLQRPISAVNIVLLPLIIGIVVACKGPTEKESHKKKAHDSVEIVVGLAVSDYEISMQNQGLVNVKDIDSSIIVDLKYSSLDNFFGEDVYGLLSSAYLQKKPAEALARANTALRNGHQNYRLIVFDAARPLSVQKILWQKLDTIPQKRRKNFVADPAEGSIHNYGCAVDLSVFDLNQKKELDMGAKYDFFGFLAYPRLEDQMLNEGKLTAAQIENRKILRQAMKSGGFEGITSEWWHFNFHDRQKSKELYKIVE